MDDRRLRFVEVQHFRQWWWWLFWGGWTVVVIGLLARSLHVQLIQGEPVGRRPMSDTALIVTAVFLSSLFLGWSAFVWWAHLQTEVREDGLYVRFFPRGRFRRLPLAEVSKVEVVTYSAILQYGGWGGRYSWGSPGGTRGKAYTVSGNRGVRLTYTTNRHLLIGSQRPDELAAAIEALRESGAGR
jgi:hypothetical protein